MKPMVKILSKVDLEKQQKQMLLLEQDYELLTLYAAIQTGNNTEMAKSKQRLAEIQSELSHV